MPPPDDFFVQVEQIREAIKEIETNTKAIEKLHSAILGESGSTATTFKSQASLDAYQNHTTELISGLRLQMKQLQNSVDSASPQDKEMKRTQHSGLAKSLMQAARYYQNVQLKFKDEYKDRIRREYRIAKPSATDKEIEEAVEAKTNVFATQMATQSIGKSKKALEDMSSRHQEILKIEKSVTELYDLFVEMQSMLDIQQEKINVIENNTSDATEGIKMGNKEMEKAIKHRISSRKMAWLICICVSILLTIAIILIFNYIINPIIKTSSNSRNTPVNTAPVNNVPTNNAPTNAAAPPAAAPPATALSPNQQVVS